MLEEHHQQQLPHIELPPAGPLASDTVSKQILQIASSRRGSITSQHKGAGSILDLFRSSDFHPHDPSTSLEEDMTVTEHTPLRSSTTGGGYQQQLLRDNGGYSQFQPIEPHQISSDMFSQYSAADASSNLQAITSLSTLKRMISRSTLQHIQKTGHLPPQQETTFSQELVTLTRFSVPLVITFLLQYSLNVASVFSVGKIGKTELAAVSLSTMTANISGYCLIQGCATALDTLCPQAYGRGDFKAVGMHFMRCTIFLMLLVVPISLVWILGAPVILSWIVEDDQVLIELACGYLKILIVGLPGFILFETLKKFLQAQNIFHASTYVILVAAPFNALLNYYLVWSPYSTLGFYGAPTAMVITNHLMAILLLAYTMFVNGYQCWCGFSSDLFTNWSKLLHLAYNGTISVISEWFFFELITLSAAKFGTVELASQSVLTTICIMMYQIPFAISIASSTRVANFIGAASKDSCLITTKASIYFSLIIGLVNASILTVFKTPIVRSFTNDEQVIALAQGIIPLGALYQINDCLSAVTGGILRGQGRQRLAAASSLISYYVFALPFALFMGFYMQWKLAGLWSGLVLAIFSISCIQTCGIVYGSDWEGIIEESLNEVATADDNIGDLRSVISNSIHH